VCTARNSRFVLRRARVCLHSTLDYIQVCVYFAAAGDLINNWEYRGKTAKFILLKRETYSAAEISFRSRYYSLCLFRSAGYDKLYIHLYTCADLNSIRTCIIKAPDSSVSRRPSENRPTHIRCLTSLGTTVSFSIFQKTTLCTSRPDESSRRDRSASASDGR